MVERAERGQVRNPLPIALSGHGVGSRTPNLANSPSERESFLSTSWLSLTVHTVPSSWSKLCRTTGESRPVSFGLAPWAGGRWSSSVRHGLTTALCATLPRPGSVCMRYRLPPERNLIAGNVRAFSVDQPRRFESSSERPRVTKEW